MTHFVRFEGGHLGVSGDRAAAAAWYERHLGLRESWSSDDEGQTLLAFPRRFALPLLDVHAPLWGERGHRNGSMRLAFACGDLASTHATLQRDGVRVSPITADPDGDFFRFEDGEGTELVAVDVPTAHDGIDGWAPPRIGVTDLARACRFYCDRLGMTLHAYGAGRALLGIGDFLPLRLEEGLPHDVPRGGFARPYLLALDLDAAHRWSMEADLRPTPIRGRPDALRVFALHDPDGNPLHVWSYPGASARLQNG